MVSLMIVLVRRNRVVFDFFPIRSPFTSLNERPVRLGREVQSLQRFDPRFISYLASSFVFQAFDQVSFVSPPLSLLLRSSLFSSLSDLSSTLLSLRHSTYKNLFFIGASTQPGTGVPVIVAGSKVISSRIHRFLQGKETWLDNDDVGFNLKVLVTLITILIAFLAVGLKLIRS